MVKESAIEGYLRTAFLKQFPQGQIHKYTPRKSEPDRILLLPGGVTVFVEVKRPGGYPRDDQLRALARLRELGFCARWVCSKGGVDDLINDLKDRYI